MRYSNTSVEQFQLGRLVEAIDDGVLGIPEFQRDFDWTDGDMRSLLATVFSGWPAGSLLLVEALETIFELRAMEEAPPLANKVKFAVLDGQQRLTSLYQALYGRGEVAFAVSWDAPTDQEIEESIVSFKQSVWLKKYATIEQQLAERIIPITALQSATTFFHWRDRLLAVVHDPKQREILRENITNLYTYRLSSIHSYEFPVVKLLSDIEPSAIARIFEKVNKTGLTLNAFDLMVAKSFDPQWNLRARWLEARENYPNLNGFFGEDGLPLLQAISLLKTNDLRQSAVLSLSKYDVQSRWDEVASSASQSVSYLRQHCGVIRRDLMPYANLLPALIALHVNQRLDVAADTISQWFWFTGFGSVYDAAANTRLVSHYKSLRDGTPLEKWDEPRIFAPATATKKSQKAAWSAVVCAIIASSEASKEGPWPDEIVAELDVSTLYSLAEISESLAGTSQKPEHEFRGALNSFLAPRRMSSVTRHLGRDDTLAIWQNSEFGRLWQNFSTDIFGPWSDYRRARAEWLVEFMLSRGVTGLSVQMPGLDDAITSAVVL